MRNGNHDEILEVYKEKYVLILPMRNGNVVVLRLPNKFIWCSYPTYEEWKPFWIKNKSFWSFFCSYPTYEEWKRAQLSMIISAKDYAFLSYLWGMETYLPNFLFKMLYRSYPTYEEWKPIFHKCPSFYKLYVLILPMRNGNPV